VNEPAPEHIPGRRRRLLVVIVAAAAIGLIAAAAVALAAGGGGTDAASSGANERCRHFTGTPPLVLQLPGPALPTHAGADSYLDAARSRLPAGDVRVAVAQAVAGYQRAGIDTTLTRLDALSQDDPAVLTNTGLVELWSGRCRAAEATLRRARAADPYGFYGTSADNTLHAADMLPNYPLYIAGPGAVQGSPAMLRRRLRRHPDDAGAWLGLAYAEQRSDHADALAAARRALALDPTGVDPRVAVAVLGFQKDNPSASFSVLGPLVQQTEDPSEIRFHLGMMLYWMRQSTDAEAQWRQVAQDSPGSVWGRTAARLLAGGSAG
jgi:Flp pilus assembly protein TadD